MAGHHYPSEDHHHNYLSSPYTLISNLLMTPTHPISIKELTYKHGEPTMVWEEDKVNNMIRKSAVYCY
ncbi:hypothetical protein HAX54_029494, partial [Datura stramonium]|nr:hypothetical protein [Datura stramonium]